MYKDTWQWKDWAGDRCPRPRINWDDFETYRLFLSIMSGGAQGGDGGVGEDRLESGKVVVKPVRVRRVSRIPSPHSPSGYILSVTQMAQSPHERWAGL